MLSEEPGTPCLGTGGVLHARHRVADNGFLNVHELQDLRIGTTLYLFQ